MMPLDQSNMEQDHTGRIGIHEKTSDTEET